MVVLDTAKSKILIYSGGYTLVHKIDTTKLLANTLSGPILSDLKVTNLSNGNGSNIQLHLSDGS